MTVDDYSSFAPSPHYGCIAQVVPSRWYRNIVRDNGKSDMLAVSVLALVVNFYPHVKVRQTARVGFVFDLSEVTSDDLLQLSYETIARELCVSKRQVRSAMVALEQVGVVKRHFRTIEDDKGMRLSNVLFIELVADKLFELTCH